MLDGICNDAKHEMDKVIEALKKHLASIRTGRASATLLDGVRVDYYGTPTPINQASTITTPEPRLIMIKPWEKAMLKPIEKAIMESNLGLVPANDGDVIRVPLPALTEERRREFVKQAKQRCEEAKVAVRNARRDANEMLKEALKDSDIGEDDEKKGLKQVQDLTDKYIAEIDKIGAGKEAEIMTV